MKLQIARLQIATMLGVLVAGAAGRRLRGGQGVPPGRRGDARRQPRRGGRRVPQGGAGRARQRELQDRAAARDAGGVARAPREGAASSSSEDQLEAALGEYKAGQRIRSEQPHAPRPRSPSSIGRFASASRRRGPSRRFRAMRERARAASAEPILNPASREPLNLHFNNVSLRDILNAIGAAHGINVSFDREFADRAATVNLDGVTLEQALNQIMTMNQLSYKVLSERSIFVFQDTPPKHAQYDEQVIRTFYLSHADSTEVQQILSTIIRLPGIAVQPAIAGNKTANTITVRGTTSVVGILEKIIEQNDKPRAEIVDRRRDPRGRSRRARKSYGLNLSEYALGGDLLARGVAERHDDRATTGDAPAATGGTTSTTHRHVDAAERRRVAAAVQPEHDLARRQHRRLLSRRADGDRAVPRERHATPRSIAKPQLRGAEGTKLTLKLGAVDSGDLDQLHADRDRRRRRQPAELVPVPGRRREHRHDADGDARRRHPPRPDARQQPAGRRHQRRRRRPCRRSCSARSARGCACATASRTCSRACCRRTTRRASRDFPALIHVPFLSSSSRATPTQSTRPRS